MTVERDWFWFWFYYALWLASVFSLVLVLRQSSENRSNWQLGRTLVAVSCTFVTCVVGGILHESDLALCLLPPPTV